MIIVVLAVVGLCLGSFVNALVWRLHEQGKLKAKKKSKQNTKTLSSKDLSISRGRSMCQNCHHTLAPKDLIPVLSWIELRGKCRYCGAKIEDTPLTEIGMALIIIVSYIWWPYVFNTMGTVNFIAWIMLLTGFVALLIYDKKWMILPDRIIFPLVIISAITAILNITAFHGGVDGLKDLAFSLVIASGLFYGLYELSKGKWIGFGDVKLGLVIGLVLGVPMHAFLVIFIASLIGTVAVSPGLIVKKIKSNSHIPFGPYLIIATIIVRLFGASIVTWYRRKFLLY